MILLWEQCRPLESGVRTRSFVGFISPMHSDIEGSQLTYIYMYIIVQYIIHIYIYIYYIMCIYALVNVPINGQILGLH